MRVLRAVAIFVAWPLGIAGMFCVFALVDDFFKRHFGPVPLWAWIPQAIAAAYLYVSYCWRAAKR